VIVDVPGAIYTGVNGINDLGQIVGDSYDGTTYHSFIATPVPVPEPSTFTMIGLVLSGILSCRRILRSSRDKCRRQSGTAVIL
jgi:hypothetical protein